MKHLKLFLVVFSLPVLILAQKSKTQDAIVFIERTSILKATAGFEKNSKEVDSLQQMYSKEIQGNLTKLNANIEQLLSPYNFGKEKDLAVIKSKLKPADLDKLELYIKENEFIDKAAKNYELVVKTMYGQKVQPLLTKINTTIAEYAQANQIKMVFTLEDISPALAYVDKGINITEEIIKRLK